MKLLDPRAVWLFFISFILRSVVFVVLLGVYLTIIFLDFGQDAEVSLLKFLWWLWIAVPFYLLVGYIWARLTYHFYRYELVNDAIRKEHGIIWKKYVSIPYDRIQNVDIYRGVVARLLGLSDLHIQTAGASAQFSRYGAWGLGAEGRLRGFPALARRNCETN